MEQKPVIEAYLNGIDGSGSVARIHEEKCLWLENVKLKPGSVEKRRGFNPLGRVPLHSLQAEGDTIYLESLPVVTLTDWRIKLFDGDPDFDREINRVLQGNQLTVEANDLVSVIAEFDNVPEGLEITEDTLFRVESEFFTPLHVFGTHNGTLVVLFPMSLITTLGQTYAGLQAVNSWEVPAGQPMTLMYGSTFSYVYASKFAYIAVDPVDLSLLRLGLRDTDILDWPPGTRVLFEGVWFGPDRDNVQYAVGVILEEVLGEVFVQLDEPLEDWQFPPDVSASVTGRPLTRDYVRMRLAHPRTKVGEVVFTDTRINGVNSLQSNAWAGLGTAPRSLYGQPEVLSSPLVALSGIEQDRSAFKLAVATPAILYEFENRNNPVRVATVPGSTVEITGQRQLTYRLENGRIGIPVLGLTPYQEGDRLLLIVRDADGTVFRTVLDFEGVLLEVENPWGQDLLVAKGSDVDVMLYREQTVYYERKGNRLALTDTTEFYVGALVQVLGINYEFQVLEVTDTDIRIDTEITYSSLDTVTLMPDLVPSAIAEEHVAIKPLDTATYPLEGVSTEVTQFANSLVFVSPNAMYKFNGREFSRFIPPAPPTPFYRSVPDTRSYIPTKRDTNEVAIAPIVRIVVTYAWYDQLGTLHESPITPEYDLEITPRVSTVLENYCEIIELQVLNVPRGLGYPADNMEIRAYVTAEGINREMLMVLDQGSVTRNNPDAPYSTILVGAFPYELNFTGYQLYSVQQLPGGETRGNNARPPLARAITTAMSRLFAAGGNSEPYWNLTCLEAFDSETTEFSGWAELQHRDKLLHTVTLAGSYEAPYYELESQGKGTTFTSFKDSTAAASLEILSYTDVSRTFGIKFPTLMLPEDIWVLNEPVVFRSTGVATERNYPFDFKGGKFKIIQFNLDGFLLEAEDGQWEVGFETDDPISTSTNVYRHYLTLPPDSWGLGGDHLVLAHIGDASIQPEITIRIRAGAVDWATALINKMIVVHGLGTRGNFRVRGSTSRLSWDRDLEWKVASVSSIPAASLLFPGGKRVVLTPYLQGQVLTLDREFSQISAEDNTFLMSSEGVGIYDLPPDVEPAHLILSQPPAPDHCFISVTGHDYQVGDYLCIEHTEQVAYNLPNFVNTEVLEVLDAFTVKVRCPRTTTALTGVHSQTFTGSTITRIYSPLGAPSLFAIVGGLFVVSIPNDYVPGDYVFMLTRGYDYFSVAQQLSGYFRVVSRTATTVTLATNEAILFKHISSIALGGVLHTPRLVDGVTGEITLRIPIPCGRALGPLDSLNDLAMPLFSPRGIEVPLNQVVKRLGLAFNSVFGDLGFAYWGGAVDGVLPYPENGFRVVAHRYPIDRYREYTQIGGDYFYEEWNPTEAEYLNPFDRFTFTGTNYRLEFFDVATRQMQTGTPTGDFTYRIDSQGSRVWWTEETGDRPSGGGIAPQFKVENYTDLNSNDGDYITGLIPFENFLLAFKQHSVWRLEFTEVAENESKPTLVANKLAYAVGAINHKCLVATARMVFFTHETGVYATDGIEIKPVLELDRYFREGVRRHKLALSKASSTYDPEEAQVIMSMPYNTVSSVSAPTGQFVFTDKESINGWSYNSIPDVTAWFTNRGDVYYIRGNLVWKQLAEDALLKYRDGTQAITTRVRTAYLTGDNASVYKFFSRLGVQVRGEGWVNIGFAANYTPDFTEVGRIRIAPKGWGVQPWGKSFYGTYEIHESLREGTNPNRAVSLSAEIMHNGKDEFFELSGVWFEGTQHNMRMVRNT